MRKKKFQYSKLLPFFTFILFCICIYKVFSTDLSNVYDVSIYATVITCSGSLCLTSIVWYLKNSQAEKVANIKADTYRIASEERYKYNKAMLELKDKYKYTDEELNDIEYDSPMDEFENDALVSLENSVDSAMEDASSSIEAHNI